MKSYREPPIDPRTWAAERRQKAADPHRAPKSTREASDRALYVQWKRYIDQKERGQLTGLSTETVSAL